MKYRDIIGIPKKSKKQKPSSSIIDSLEEQFGSLKLNEGQRFKEWQAHLKNLDELYKSVHWAKKAIPHKKKTLQKIEKHYKELQFLVEQIQNELFGS